MTSPGSMSRDEVDRAIVGLGAAYDQISAAMYDLDARPGLTMLRGGGLGGRTREVAVRVLAGTEVLWSHFAALGAHLQQARSVRGERSRPGEAEAKIHIFDVEEISFVEFTHGSKHIPVHEKAGS